jgi:hypothetical protein
LPSLYSSTNAIPCFQQNHPFACAKQIPRCNQAGKTRPNNYNISPAGLIRGSDFAWNEAPSSYARSANGQNL